MNKWLVALGGSLWCALVFYVAFRVTFPSDALIDRARFELDRATAGGMAMQIERVSPWWVGLKARELVLIGDDGETMLRADVAKVRVSPFSLLSEPHVHATVQFGKGALDADAVIIQDARGPTASRIRVEADRFPIGAIPPIAGYQIRGTGTLDLDADLRAPSGLGKADGSVRLSGRTMNIEDIGGLGEMLGGFQVLPLAIDELDLRIEITQGKGRVVVGAIRSSLVTVELTGDITLDDVLTRSRLRLQATVDLGAALQPFAGLLSSARWSDGRFRYAITGTIGRPSATPEPERAARRTPTARPETPSERSTEDTPARPPAPETVEAAREARERRMEALRERRAARGGAAAREVPAETTREREVAPDRDDVEEEVYDEDAPLDELEPGAEDDLEPLPDDELEEEF